MISKYCLQQLQNVKYENLAEITFPIYFYSWFPGQKHVYTHCIVNGQKVWCFERVSDQLFKHSATVSFTQSKCFPEASDFLRMWTQHMNMCWRTPGIMHVLQPSQNYSSCDINPTRHDYWNTRYLVKGWKHIKGTQTNFPEAKIWLVLEKSVHNYLYINTKYAFSQLFTGEARRMKTPGHSVITGKYSAKIPNSTDTVLQLLSHLCQADQLNRPGKIQHSTDCCIWATKSPPPTLLAAWECLFRLSETPVIDSWW